MLKFNDTLSNMFNAAFGIETLRRSVLESKSTVTRTEGMLALLAGDLASQYRYTFDKACAHKDRLIDEAGAILDKAKDTAKTLKPGQKRRTKDEQKAYARCVTKWNDYMGEGKSNRANRTAKAKSKNHISSADILTAAKALPKADIVALIAKLSKLI